ncbi:MAG: NAD-dependent epimerase/dehydratase family protein [Actinomycetales bacterium]|nr:NAD-dependent epimerase/dehydratase family protein [Actinomycetales bacterium]
MSLKDLGTVLVTGGAGFIGCALSHELADSASRWVVFDNLHPQIHPSAARPADLHEKAELILGDVVEATDWDALLSDVKPDVVIHLAAETGTAQSLHEASRHSLVNVVGTTQMLDAFGRAGHVPSRILLSSSRAVYGEGAWQREDGTLIFPGQRTHSQLEAGQWDVPGARSLASEASLTAPAPTSVYGATKLAQEHILRAWINAHDAKLTILRLQNVYGPGQSLINSYTGIVSLFSQWAREGKEIPVYEDGNITRDFVYIKDVASAFAAALARAPQDDEVPFDIGSGSGTSILSAAQFIANYYEAPAPRITGAFRDGDVRHATCDITRSVTELNWSPTWSVEEGLAALQVWINAQLKAGSPSIVEV